DLLIYGVEFNQILQTEHQTILLGCRFQTGHFSAQDQLNPTFSALDPYFAPPNHDMNEGFQRITGYAYYTAILPLDLYLTGGLAYDDTTYPRNFQDVPVSSGQSSRSQIGPKASLVWSPVPEFTIRSAYAKSLGGVSIDESFRLEPVQLAGFTQTFRNVMPVA